MIFFQFRHRVKCYICVIGLNNEKIELSQNYKTMKNLRILAFTLFAGLSMLFISCDDEIQTPIQEENLLPTRFTVDVPTALTTAQSGSGRVATTFEMQEMDGNDIYGLLRVYILVGKEAGEIVEDVMTAISLYGIDRPMTMTYSGDEDGRTKNLEVVEGATYDGVSYQYALTITDADSEGNADGGFAMQIFWDRSPVKGVALLNPYNINRDDRSVLDNTLFRIDYDETGENGYQASMEVSITGLLDENDSSDQFALDNLKMFVGKTDDGVDIYGNSNHPMAKFFNDDTGFNWAFVAAGNKSEDLAVAEVGLPPSTLNSDLRAVILGDYAIKTVFEDQIREEFPNISQALLDQYLANTEAPGYFDSTGFIQGGESPGSQFDVYENRIQDLTPFNPLMIANLEITFNQ